MDHSLSFAHFAYSNIQAHEEVKDNSIRYSLFSAHLILLITLFYFIYLCLKFVHLFLFYY